MPEFVRIRIEELAALRERLDELETQNRNLREALEVAEARLAEDDEAYAVRRLREVQALAEEVVRQTQEDEGLWS